MYRKMRKIIVINIFLLSQFMLFILYYMKIKYPITHDSIHSFHSPIDVAANTNEIHFQCISEIKCHASKR